MSQRLTNRLARLECEIQQMLRMQEDSLDQKLNCRQIRSTSLPPCPVLKQEIERRKQAEAKIDALRREMDARLKESNENRSAAFDITRQLKEKYECIQKNNQEAASKLKTLHQRNNFLCKCLKEQTEAKQDLQNDVGQMQEDTCRQIDRIETDTLMSTKKIVKTNEKLARIIREKDLEIKKLTEIQERLEKACAERDSCSMKAYGKYAKMEMSLQRCSDKVKKLSEDKNKVKNDLKNLQIRHQESQKINKKLRADIKDYEATIKTYDEEMDKIKEEMEKKIGQKMQRKMEQIADEYRRKNEDLQEELQNFRNKFEQLQCDCEERQRSEKELQRLMDEHRQLQLKYDDLLAQLNEFECEDNKKCKNIEKEMKSLVHIMNQKETMMVNEKNEMKKLVQDLTEIIKEHKERILDLQMKNKQVEAVLQSQAIALKSKDEQISLLEEEAQAIKKKNQQMEKHNEQLQQSVNALDQMRCEGERCSKRNQSLLCELKRTTQSLEKEKDTVLLKDKVIQDQTNTLKQLKSEISGLEKELRKAREKTETSAREVQTCCCEMKRHKAELEKQKQENQQLMKDLANVKLKKEQLKKKVENLESALETFCKCACSDEVDNQQQLITNLERQVIVQQREWELHKKIMGKEKEQAMKAARFATEKLLDTVDDFQKQVESQKEIQKTLTGLLHEKQEQLHHVTTQAARLWQQLRKQMQSEMALREMVNEKFLVATDVCADLARKLSLIPLSDDSECQNCQCT